MEWREISYQGKHYQLEDIQFHPTPLQQPRIPVWLAGVWPGSKPFQRAAKWDGIFPLWRHNERGEFPPDEVCNMLAYIDSYRSSDDPFDAVLVTRSHKPGETKPEPTDEYMTRLADMKDAGLTWALEALDMKASHDEIMAVITQGPPRVE